MNIEHMVEFVELAHDLNFTAAARRLHITQPALSNHIRALEQECGGCLIERGGRAKPRLTPAGQLFLDMCVEILGHYDRAMPAIRDAGRQTRGRIAVRTPRNEFSYPFIDYLFEFRKLHPTVDVAMLPWSPTDGIDDVLSKTVDIAYIGHAEGLREYERGMVALVPYCRAQLFLWGEEGCRLLTKPKLAPVDLDGATVLIPANEKRDSWRLCLESFQERFGVALHIEERYCDSVEDLVMTKARPGDLMLCDENTLKFAAFRLREHHRAVPFDPPVSVPVSMGYDARTKNGALLELVEFLARKAFNSADPAVS